MGFFTHTWNTIKSKVKQAGNWHDIANKSARVWNQGTQVLGKSRNFIGKAKRVAEVSMLVPGLGEIAGPIAAGLETADFALGEIDKHRKTAERYGRKGKKIVSKMSGDMDKYAERADTLYQTRDFKGAVKLGRDVYKDGRKTYKQGQQAYKRGRDKYNEAKSQYNRFGWRGNQQQMAVSIRQPQIFAQPQYAQPRRNQRAIANRPYYEPVW